VATYKCPSDPTIGNEAGHSSYGQNGQLFRHSYPGWGLSLYNYPANIPDGTSNTIFITEKLAHCDSGSYPDNYWPDWGPILASSDLGMPTGVASIPQIQPPKSPSNANWRQCDGGRASTFHSGIVTGLGDGSVRTVSRSVNGATWWAAITPADGDVLGSNW
jgi:hypothetical protein